MSKIITPKKPDLSCHSTTIKPSQCKWKSIVNPYPKDNWSQKRNGLEVYTRSISTDKSEECTYVSHALPKELSEGLWSGIWHIIFVSILDLDNQHRSDFLPLYLFHTVMCRSQCSSFNWQSTCSICKTTTTTTKICIDLIGDCYRAKFTSQTQAWKWLREKTKFFLVLTTD